MSEEVRLEGDGNPTNLVSGGNIICETDMELRVGDPLVMKNKWSDYPIMEDKFVVRGYQSDLDKQEGFAFHV